MKKTILTTTLALGLGVTGFAAGQDAEASSYNLNKEELAYTAQNNPEALNASALHEVHMTTTLTTKTLTTTSNLMALTMPGLTKSMVMHKLKYKFRNKQLHLQ